jgi:DNA uptake protein ComE-like DNA-binding protein
MSFANLTNLRQPQRRRGSTILMVLAILAILTLMAILLTYTARQETSSARNAGIAVQNRISALTGIDFVATDMVISGIGTPMVGAPDLDGRSHSSRVDEDLDTDSLAYGETDIRSDTPLYLSGRALTPHASLLIADAAGRININTADEAVLEKFFDQLATRTGGGFSGARVARAIVETRLGRDGAPGNSQRDDAGVGRDAAELLTTGRAGASSFLDTRGDAANRLARETLRERTRESDRIQRMDERSSRQKTREQLLGGADSPEDFVGDIRRPAFGDDVRFTTVGDLLSHPQIKATGLTVQALQQALPHLTTFSASLDRQPAVTKTKDDEEPRALLDINRASVEEIYAELKNLYGGSKNDRLLKQFAVNIVDARDFDSTPTIYPGTEGSMPVIGVERTPYITEVFPQTPAPEEQGNDGQFVELYNPWTEDIDVTGWQLRGAGISISLSGSIAAKGYLIVTSDADNRNDPLADQELRGTGSLYDLFGVVGNTTSRRVLERRNLQLDRRSPLAELRLENSAQELVDHFVYQPVREPTNGTTSYQRDNPLVRYAKRARPTPFGQAPGSFSDSTATRRLASYPVDGPFVSVTDLLDVFAGFVDYEARELEMWSFPAVATPRSAEVARREMAESKTRIDARVMDLFSVEFRERPAGIREEKAKYPQEVEFAMERGAGRVRKNDGADRRPADDFAALHADAWISPVGHRLGRINLNTADATVLASLPGVSPQMAQRIVRERLATQNEALTHGGWRPLDSPLPKARWEGPSDVLVDLALWGDSLSEEDRIDRLRALLPHVTFSSRSFVLRSQARIPGSNPDSPEAVAGVPMEAVVATDRGTAEVISLRRVRELMGEVDTVRPKANTSNRVGERARTTAAAQ